MTTSVSSHAAADLPHRNELKRQLDESGFVVIEDFFTGRHLNELRTATERQFAMEGDSAGSEFRLEEGSRRLANLVNKGEVFRRIITEPRMLSCVGLVLKNGFKLSSLNARSANPHNRVPQPLHADMGAIPDDSGDWVCNCVWTLDDFTPYNGALRVVPGSHRWNRLPQDAMDDPTAPHPQEQVITARAGSLIVLNAHVWHGGMENRTDSPRSAIHAFFVRPDKPQQQYQKLLLDEDVKQMLSVEERSVLALDDPLNDRVTLSDPQRSGFLK